MIPKAKSRGYAAPASARKALGRALQPQGPEEDRGPRGARAVKMPLSRAVCAAQGHDREGYFFLPWFFTASMAALAASGSR